MRCTSNTLLIFTVLRGWVLKSNFAGAGATNLETRVHPLGMCPSLVDTAVLERILPGRQTQRMSVREGCRLDCCEVRLRNLYGELNAEFALRFLPDAFLISASI